MANRFANIRKDYSKNTIDERKVEKNPFDQFLLWLNDAIEAGIEEPNAMALATVSEKGFPSARMVLLKHADRNGFVFFTNYNSRKGRHLETNPNAALLFHWEDMERQVRIEGRVEKTEVGESDAYFNLRPTDSRINAIISPQSKKIPDRDTLEQLRADYIASGAAIVRPENWGGYRLKPVYFEFWQGRPNRLHDRISYCGSPEEGWKIRRLAP